MSENKQKLFLFDAFALIYRSFFAFSKNPRLTSQGFDTSAIYGFLLTILDVLDKEKPSHLAVVFDSAKPTFRHEKFEEYKAHREAMPEGIQGAIPYIFKLLKAMNITTIALDGYEADDIIGTLALKAPKDDFDVYMMTPDKDYAQLVRENVFMYRPSRMGKGVEIWGIPEVCEKFEVKDPMQVIDYLAMMGDASDNIPGIPGVGDKTAKKLIGLYENLEGLYEHAEELKGKQKEKVIDNKEQAFMSKWLATIALDVPVDLDEKELKYKQIDKKALEKLFVELEFSSLGRKVIGMDYQSNHAAPKPNTKQQPQLDLFAPEPSIDESVQATIISDKNNAYQLVQSEQDINKLIELLFKQKSFCFDTETTGLDTLEASLIGISFSCKDNEAFYLPVPEDEDQAKALLTRFRPIFGYPHIEKIAHNLKFDLNILAKYNVHIGGPLFDSMLAHYLLEPDMRHNMDYLSEVYLSYKPVSIESLIGPKGKNQKSLKDIPMEQLLDYACEDADITWQLANIFKEKLKEANLEEIFNTMEMPLVPVLAKMERNGICLDSAALHNLEKTLEQEVLQITDEIYALSEIEFNIASPKQLGEILFDQLKLDPKAKKTKTGQYSTSEAVLSKLKDKHPIIEKVLEFRSIQKLRSTYVEALPKMVSPITNRIHTSYNQAVAATGRLSSNNPNLQNIPIRTERGKLVRQSFIAPSEDTVLLAADYSQIELRLIAEMSEDKHMVEAFLNGEDIHRSTASKVFNVPLEEVDATQRSNAKTVNFGIIYGVSAFGLSQQTDLSRSEAKEIINTYFENYSQLKSYMDNQVAFAREHGYVTTLLGRRRWLRDINSRNGMVRQHAERNAINAPIQGTAADIIKLAMIDIHKKLEEGNFKSKMLLQVHDELVFEVPKEEIERLSDMVKESMEQIHKTKVPLTVEVGMGKNWLEAH